MSLRAWLSVASFGLIAIILFFSRHELVHAWQLLGQVNLWILFLLIPAQIIVYYAGGEMIFSYLKAKGRMQDVKWYERAGIALEGNFVNHVFPSGGLSGLSYLTWRLGRYNVPAGRATMAQIVRHVAAVFAFGVLLFLSLFIITIDGEINRWTIFASAVLIILTSSVIVSAIYLLSSKSRTDSFAVWLAGVSKKIVRTVTFGRKKRGLDLADTKEFFSDMHHDYIELKHDKKLLIKPFWWGMLFTVLEAGLFYITFLALGEVLNPAPILIAYGVALVAAFFVITPGGAGAYEAIMVAFLAVAGLSQGVAIAGVVLTRVIVLIGTIVFGYYFYQRALIKYGKPEAKR